LGQGVRVLPAVLASASAVLVLTQEGNSHANACCAG
jgi:hypothetical protein